MYEKILEHYRLRLANFLKPVSDDLVYREFIPLEVSLAVTDRRVPFEQRLELTYHPVREGEIWGHDWSFGWFRFTAEVPERFAGKELCLRIHTGAEMLLFDEGGVPVYGLTGYSVFDELYCKERYVIGKDFRPGEKLEFWMEGAGHGLFGCPLPSADDPEGEAVASCGTGTRRLKHMRLCVFDREMWGMLADMRVLYGVLRSDPAPTYRSRRLLRILTEALEIFDRDCANAGKVRRFLAEKAFSCGASEALPKVCAIGHGHIDIGWLWRVSAAVGKAARTFSSQIALLEKYPEYVFGASQPALYRMVRDEYPALYTKIRRAVASGRWELQGGMYVEADCNLTSGESLVRQFIHGKNFFRDEFGVEVTTLWLPDVFGYSGNLPQIAVKSGCPFFLTQKLSWNEFDTMPYHSFRWRGVDGSTLLVHFPPENNYNAFASSEQRIAAMDRFAEAGLCDSFISLYGIGDGGGGPSEDFVENNLRQKNLDGCPRVFFGRADRFFGDLAASAGKLPEIAGELYFENHQGTLTSQAEIKRNNRKCEQALAALEFLASALPFADYPASELDRLWKMLLLNQFHDILPGSSIRGVYETAAAEHREILKCAGEVARQAAEKLFHPAPECAVAVNTLSVPYRAPVKLPDGWTGGAETADGTPLAAQLEEGAVIVAADLPPDSFTTLRRGNFPVLPAEKFSGTVLENDLIRYTFSPGGQLTGAWDKEWKREILSAPGNVLTLYHDRPLNYEAWNLDIAYPREKSGVWEGGPDGPGWRGQVRSGIRFRYRRGESELSQQVILAAGSRRLDFVTRVRWRENRTMLRVAFPAAVMAHEAAYDIQYAYIRRPTTENNLTEQAQFECCGQRYADLSDGERGAALLNDGKYGYRVKGNVLDLALLRSPRYPDAEADRGEHEFTYSFLPHAGDLAAGGVIGESAVLNRQPMLFSGYEAGDAEPVCVQVSGRDISLEVVKKAEKSDAWVIRVTETAGRHSAGILRWHRRAAAVRETDLVEWHAGEEEPLEEGLQHLSLAPFEIKTFMVTKWQ